MAKTKKNLRSVMPDSAAKSVPSPSARSEGLCFSESEQLLSDQIQNIENFLKFNKNKVLVFLVGLLYCYGLRVSELLALDCSCVLGNDQLLIKGSKGSESRVVTVVYGKEFYSTFLLNEFPLSAVFSRFWLYRELKRYGLYAYFANNKNASVTHLSRHLKVLEFKAKGVPRGTISQFLGHKSLKSLTYYEQPVKQRSK